jgi:hypothetical protein
MPVHTSQEYFYMSEKTINDYINELLDTYNQSAENPWKSEKIVENPTESENISDTVDLNEKNIDNDDKELENLLNDEIFNDNTDELKGEGFLKVSVSTAQSAIPVENASVLITALKNGKYELIGSYLTDNSGQTQIINLPAPLDDESLIEDGKNVCSYYDIRVRKEGFFDFESLNVPIFDKITSLQSCYIIPIIEGSNPTEANFVVDNG